MSKLFAGEKIGEKNFSTEEFRNYHGTAKVVSTEAITDFFYKLKDSFNTLSSSIAGLDNDKIVTDVLATRFETSHVAKRVKFVELRDESVSKPEKFKGKYVEFSEDMIKSAGVLVDNTQESLSNLKMAVASFINEYSEDKVATLYGISYFKDAEKVTEAQRKDIAKYFTGSGVKASVGDVLKSLSDIDVLFSDIQTLDSVLNQSKIEHIGKLANEVSELIDVLIEQNTKTGVLLKNDSVKKELISAVHIVAKEVELVSYLYSNCIFFYSGVKTLSEKIIEVGNRS
jgi:hypothetical protein